MDGRVIWLISCFSIEHTNQLIWWYYQPAAWSFHDATTEPLILWEADSSWVMVTSSGYCVKWVRLKKVTKLERHNCSQQHVPQGLSWKTTPLAIKLWSLKTGDLWWHVQLHWNIEPSATNTWSFKTMVSHGHGLLKQVSLYNESNIPTEMARRGDTNSRHL